MRHKSSWHRRPGRTQAAYSGSKRTARCCYASSVILRRFASVGFLDRPSCEFIRGFVLLASVFGPVRAVLEAATFGPHRLHGNDLISSRLTISIGNFKVHFIALDLKFAFLADGKDYRMLTVHGTDVLLDLIGTQQALRT